MELYKLMGYELRDKLKRSEITLDALYQSIFERIHNTEDLLHSFVHISEESALEKAYKYQSKLDNGKKIGSLCGLPFANKDLICIKDFPTTCCSKILADYTPPYNATVIEQLNKEGAIHIGNTNMDEFAMGSSTENSCYGPTHNPWDLDKVPGGSSGGAASAVASGQTVFALGSDTGGSVRCPASFCGVVGLKPTYGRVSRYGLIAFANSLDQIGCITKCVYDAALMLEVIAGKDSLDSTSLQVKTDKYTEETSKSISNKVIGIPKEFFGEGVSKEVKDSVLHAIDTIEGLGASSVEISIPHLEYTVATYYLICMSEASSNLARFDGLRYGYASKSFEGDVYDFIKRTRSEGFGDEVRRRIFLGTYTLSAGYYDMYYIKALKARTLIKNDFNEAFKQCDCIVSPTMPISAFKLGELVDDPVQMYTIDILTCPVNLVGVPAISIPCGFDNNEMPIGFQIIGNYFDEKTILNVAYQLEQELKIYLKMPTLKKGGS
jgi:aspartyl-tRNA(Asn)/glutamyl-tRNA(Gln) amidotransferase subunit A